MTCTEAPITRTRPSPSDSRATLITVTCPYCTGTHSHRIDGELHQHTFRKYNGCVLPRVPCGGGYCITDPDQLMPELPAEPGWDDDLAY